MKVLIVGLTALGLIVAFHATVEPAIEKHNARVAREEALVCIHSFPDPDPRFEEAVVWAEAGNRSGYWAPVHVHQFFGNTFTTPYAFEACFKGNL